MRTNDNIEDIIILLDGLISFDDIVSAPDSVKNYLKQQFSLFLLKDVFVESVSTHIEQGRSPARTQRIITFFERFCGMNGKLS
jgi:hypothetical protein